MNVPDILVATQALVGAFERAQRRILRQDHKDQRFRLASAEDVILHKLHWYKMGDEASERQWNDVLGVLKVQAETLDVEYMKKWAAELQVTSLLNRAFQEAGLVSGSTRPT